MLERQRFHPLLTAFFALVLGFILFQIVVPVVAILVRLAFSQNLSAELAGGGAEGVIQGLMGDTRFLLLINTVGQWVGLGLMSWWLARLHAKRDALRFLRVRKTDPALMALSAVGLALLLPFVLWLGTINELLPVPDWMEELQRSMMELLEGQLSDRSRLFANLFMVAVTPAICEELLFRGYVQRQCERALGVRWAIVVTGVLFGMYHLQPTHVVPLSVLGIYLAYLTWRTQSLWPAVLVHFLNNGAAVIFAAFVPSGAEPAAGAEGSMEVPWYIGLPALLVFVLFMRFFEARARDRGIEPIPSREEPPPTPTWPAEPSPTPIDPTRLSP